MYYEYWGLTKAPFDNVPDPSMYAECHSSMENTIAETLFAIEEGKECIAVIVGDVGLGKTTSIRLIIDSLIQEKYKIALITNPSTTFVQILREIIGQLTGKQCEEKKKIDLLETFNKLLFTTFDEGKKILIFIDEANAISPANLENLRLLTNMQEDQRNLFTMVLTGQMELAQRLEHPKRANLFQRIGTYCRIDKIQSEDLVKTYVETRLELAGGTRTIFTEDAFPSLWKHSEHGIPRLINKVCKLSLKAGETNQLKEINREIIDQVGERFQKMTGPSTQKRRPRKRSIETMERTVPVQGKKFEHLPGQTRAGHEESEVVPAFQRENLLKATSLCKAGNYSGEERLNTVMEEKTGQTVNTFETKDLSIAFGKDSVIMNACSEELKIGEYKVVVNFSSEFMKQVQSSDPDDCIKLAGVMAAQTLKENPQLAESPASDPVYIWDQIKEFILRKIVSKKTSTV
ncbi:MAG: AAA family ATPase [Candidatus Scalindua sp.]|nr:AAA family ATPase [Candidatus Scalindua sp.]